MFNPVFSIITIIIVISDINCYDVFVEYYDDLLEAVTFPLSLANGLSTAGLVSSELVDHVLSVKGTSDRENVTRILKEIRVLLRVSKKRPQQRERMMKFCKVLLDQGSPILSTIALQMLEDSGKDTVIILTVVVLSVNHNMFTVIEWAAILIQGGYLYSVLATQLLYN